MCSPSACAAARRPAAACALRAHRPAAAARRGPARAARPPPARPSPSCAAVARGPVPADGAAHEEARSRARTWRRCCNKLVWILSNTDLKYVYFG